MAEAMKLQKMKLMAMNTLQGNGSQNGTESEPDDLNSNTVSLPPASVAMAMNQMNHLNTIANMAAAAQIHSPLSRAGASVIKFLAIMDLNMQCDLGLEKHVWFAQKLNQEVPVQIPMMKSPLDKIQLTPGQALPPGFPGPFIFADSLSSVETLLTNIQGLLKVALDNAHIQEKQTQQEKKELRMELYKEREIRENLERQLAVELQSR
ncbi:hypothetical protein EI555_015007, partial [Monodon monoceros]